MSFAVIAESLEAAMTFARRVAGTDNIVVFDGSFGRINLSLSMAEFLMKKAPEVSRNVDEELLPKWLRQRGIAPIT
jgi:4-aminobutyrate aminotransferase-like enzyme